ncbi:adenine nucleotide alpha hydrolases-like protein [Byssothecium circinans]|uniref:Diphthine--ammonia ligase n=1 Tax=Byssothecium circinans TaxID=147558 RepID=A0A6A5TD65_9PLEO|nr:adenine nucleotide alpha hydrolases-like protein [Byssothecium circinans]
MTSSLQVIALISGGKDSLYSILHCLAHGHTVVALANLYPPPSTANNADAEDLNSFMYQTVGHSIIPLYSEALGLPLYRQEIRGSAVNSSRDYAEQEDDETESLVPLLLRVKDKHPEVNAVSTGAIFSTYQRTRVEHVAVRLGLTPLSYLWQYPVLPPYTQSSLLCDMHAVGQDARIIKVASGGLDEGFLWENVADPGTVGRMMKALGRFSEDGDGALVGEGGEFETLAVDGPGGLWRKRIVVEGDGVVRLEGGTAVWKGRDARVVEKDGGEGAGAGALQELRVPSLFDDEFARVLASGLEAGGSVTRLDSRGSSFSSLLTNSLARHGNVFVYSNITGETVPGLASSPQAQLTNILLRLQQGLAVYDMPKEAITQCTLLVRDMASFATVNSIYAKYFNFTNPPARVTVAVGDSMPAPFDVMLSVTAHKDTTRNGLHVQSQSYWAPANIGPYSQAISTPIVPPGIEDAQAMGNEVHIAGQIPLVPATMTLHTTDGFKGAALLSLQHLWRIARTQGVRWWTAGVAMIPVSSDRKEQEERILLAQGAWRAIHVNADEEEGQGEEEDVVDAWDRKNLVPTFDDHTARAAIPDREAVVDRSAGGGQAVPACFVAEVDALPRGGLRWSNGSYAVRAIAPFLYFLFFFYTCCVCLCLINPLLHH